LAPLQPRKGRRTWFVDAVGTNGLPDQQQEHATAEQLAQFADRVVAPEPTAERHVRWQKRGDGETELDAPRRYRNPARPEPAGERGKREHQQREYHAEAPREYP